MYAGNNYKINNVNHLRNSLKILNCFGWCGIDQKGIMFIKLEELNATGNIGINNVNHMKDTLKILNCGWGCGIGEEGISELKLERLSGLYRSKNEESLDPWYY